MVNIYKLKLTNLQTAFLRLLFIKTGTVLNANMTARYLKVTAPAVLKSIPHLEKTGLIIVKKDPESKRLSIVLNRDDHAVLWLKRVDNLKQIYESGLAQFFYDQFPEATVILFGSYAFGEDTVHSDIDIAIFGSMKKDINTLKFESRLERKVSIQHFPLLQTMEPHLKNNILNGITLKGTVTL